MSKPVIPPGTGPRLEAIRRHLGFKEQVDFAEALMASKTQYNNWAVDSGLIPVPYAVKVKELSGVTLDYIYTGTMAGMPPELVRSLLEHMHK